MKNSFTTYIAFFIACWLWLAVGINPSENPHTESLIKLFEFPALIIFFIVLLLLCVHIILSVFSKFKTSDEELVSLNNTVGRILMFAIGLFSGITYFAIIGGQIWGSLEYL